MEAVAISNKQACQFILLKQGLLGDYKFILEDGILQFVKQVGCIQYDPIDVCGKNAELVLQSRVKGFTKQMLYDLLYKERKLIDYFDKNMSILPIENWSYYNRIRERYRQDGRSFDKVNAVAGQIIQTIAEQGAVSSKELDFKDKVDWYWDDTKLSRAALETLYFRGDLIIHHKAGAVKYYALGKDFIPKSTFDAADPFPDEIEHLKWRVQNRISAVGLLWNKPSDAWLGIANMKSTERNRVFAQLLNEQKLLEIRVEDIKYPFYCQVKDTSLLEIVRGEDYRPKARMELIAPLDNMLWDRKLVELLFGFSYKWEIYTPVAQRKYGYYVLPILYGERFIGRAEIVCDKKNDALIVKRLWFEAGIRATEIIWKDLYQCLCKFMKFNGLSQLINLTDFSLLLNIVNDL